MSNFKVDLEDNRSIALEAYLNAFVETTPPIDFPLPKVHCLAIFKLCVVFATPDNFNDTDLLSNIEVEQMVDCTL